MGCVFIVVGLLLVVGIFSGTYLKGGVVCGGMCLDPHCVYVCLPGEVYEVRGGCGVFGKFSMFCIDREE